MNTFYIECYHIDQSSIIKYFLNRPHKNRETDCIVVLVSCHFSFWHCELFILIPLETIIETGIYVLRYFIVSASANIYVYVVTNMNRDRLTKKKSNKLQIFACSAPAYEMSMHRKLITYHLMDLFCFSFSQRVIKIWRYIQLFVLLELLTQI